MGSSKSKVAKAELNEKLDLVEKKHASAVKTIVVREEELERCKQEAATATSESESLRKKTDDLGAKYDALQRQRAIEVEGLKKELANELEGQVRIHESLTQERNRERKRVEQLEVQIKEVENGRAEQLKAAVFAQHDKIEALEAEAESARNDAEEQRKQMLDIRAASKKDLEDARVQAAQLQERVQQLDSEAAAANEQFAAAESSRSTSEEQHKSLSSQLTTLQSRLDSSESARLDWEEKHSALSSQLSTFTSTQDSKLQSLHYDLSTSQQKQRDLNKQVTTMQKRLDLSESKRGDLEKKYNESVSKKSALHEAFEATKMELKESYERFAELLKEVEKLRTGAGVATEKKVNGNGPNGALLAAQAAMDVPAKGAGISVGEVKPTEVTV